MSTSQGTVDEKLQLALYEETDANHRLDNLNLFIYMMLLVLTILTAWFFKHWRNRYIHETGLAVLYGLLIGVLIRQTSSPSSDVPLSYDVQLNLSQTDPLLPKRVILRTCPAQTGASNCSNATSSSLRYYEYTFQSALEMPQKSDQLDLNSKATFDPEIFFNVILPAIIFNAGYSLKRRHFFVNIGGILFFAFLGTAISAVVIGAIIYAFCQIPYFSALQFTFNDAMLFGSIISATDPVSVLAIFSELGVDVDLHALILGESVLNDAVAIVLSGAVIGYARAELSTDSDSKTAEALAVLSAVGNFFQVFVGAFAIGSATGLATALITKFTRLRDFPMLESSLFLLMSYSTFLAAEAASFSGIVALLFCGIIQAHYTYYNLSPESRTSLRHITELLSFLAENFCFLQIGVTIFTFSKHYWDFYFILVAFFAIIIGRAVNVYPMSFLQNRLSRRKISLPFQHMMMFAGLRGAMAFALAIRETETKQQRIIFSTTLVLVIVTIIFCGALVTPLLQLLHIRVGVSMQQSPSSAVLNDRRRRNGGLPADEEGLDNRLKSSALGQRKLDSSSKSSSARFDEFTALHANTPSIMLAYESTSPPSTSIDEMSIVVNEDEAIVPRASIAMTKHHWYSAKVIRSWKKVDLYYLKPIFTQCRPLLAETLPKNGFCQWIARILTTTQQYEQGADDDTSDHNGGGHVNGGPTPSPLQNGVGNVETSNNDNGSNVLVNDTDDDPIILSTDSPNIAGRTTEVSDTSNRKASSSFSNSSSIH